MAYQLILFDLDGTLVDSSDGIVNGFQYALDKFGIAVTREKLLPLIGPPILEIFKLIEPDLFADPIVARRAIKHQRVYYARQGVYECTVYPGVAQGLAELARREHTLFVATSKPTVFAKKILAHHHLSAHFKGIVGSHLNLTRTKKVEIIQTILNKYPRVDRQKICMVGDRSHDLDAARVLQIESVGVSYGYGSLEEIQGCRPTHIVKSFSELENIVH